MGDIVSIHARASAGSGTFSGPHQRSGRNSDAETAPAVTRCTVSASSADIASAVTSNQETLACEQPISLASFSWLPTSVTARRKCSFHMSADYQSLGYVSTKDLFERGYQCIGRIGPMSLASNIIRFRTKKQISQAELAKRVGVRQNTIAALESGHTKKSKHLPRIAIELDCLVSDLDKTLPSPGVKIIVHEAKGAEDPYQAGYDQGWEDAMRAIGEAVVAKKSVGTKRRSG